MARRVHQQSLVRAHLVLGGERYRRSCRVKKTLRSRVAGAFLLLVLLTSRGSTGDPAAADDHGPGPASTALAVSVSETPDAVLLHIRVPWRCRARVSRGSVSRNATRSWWPADAMGRPIRSQSSASLSQVVEEGASADYDGDGVLVDDAPQAGHRPRKMAHIMPGGTPGGFISMMRTRTVPAVDGARAVIL